MIWPRNLSLFTSNRYKLNSLSHVCWRPGIKSLEPLCPGVPGACSSRRLKHSLDLTVGFLGLALRECGLLPMSAVRRADPRDALVSVCASFRVSDLCLSSSDLQAHWWMHFLKRAITRFCYLPVWSKALKPRFPFPQGEPDCTADGVWGPDLAFPKIETVDCSRGGRLWQQQKCCVEGGRQFPEHVQTAIDWTGFTGACHHPSYPCGCVPPACDGWTIREATPFILWVCSLWVGTGWSLRSLPTQTILGFYDCNQKITKYGVGVVKDGSGSGLILT